MSLTPMKHAVMLLLGLLSAPFVLTGCSTTATRSPGSPSDLRLEIELEERSESVRYVSRSIRAVLYDRSGKAVENDKIRMLVNGVPMTFGVGQGNYYDRHPFYRLDDDAHLPVPADSLYRITLVWPDGKKVDAATIRAPQPLTPAQFDLPVSHPHGRALTIAWHGVTGSAELTARRITETAHADNTLTIGGDSPDGPNTLRKMLGTGPGGAAKGTMTIPAAYLSGGAKARVISLTVEVTARTEGTVSDNFLPGSYARATRMVKMEVDITDRDSVSDTL